MWTSPLGFCIYVDESYFIIKEHSVICSGLLLCTREGLNSGRVLFRFFLFIFWRDHQYHSHLTMMIVLIGHDESLTKILLQFRSADIKADPQFDVPFSHLKNTNTVMLFRSLLTLATLCFPDMCTEVNCGQGSLLNIVVLTEHSCPSKSECGSLPNHLDRGLV